MTIFRHSEDRIPVSIIVFLFLCDLAIYFFAENIWMVLTWFVLMIVPKVCICAWNHHHQHNLTFKSKFLNRLLEMVYAFHTGITTNAWVLHHNVGHHVNYLDQSKDESAWMRPDGTPMGMIEYTLTIAITGYFRAYKVGKKYPRYQTSFLRMGVIVLCTLAVLLYFNWLNALFLFALPMLVGYVATCWATYFHHCGLDTDNHLEASYNITHKWYNVLTGNLGYHTAHHMKQALHWSKLPEYHATIADKIPPHLYRNPTFPFCFIPG